MSLTAYCLIGIAGTLAVWYLVILAYTLANRPRPLVAGPPTMNLGPQPPALVNMLITRGRPTPAAADATLLDLAARRILELHQPGPDPAALLIRVRDRNPAGLTSYERRVFDRFAGAAGDRMVPLAKITGRYADGGPNWLRQFYAEVARDGQERGLLRRRLVGSGVIMVCLFAGMALGCLGLVPLERPGAGTVAGAVDLLLVAS
jgi:hypothetical protein